MQTFMSLYDEQLKQHACYSFTMLISFMILIHFKWQSSSFRLHQIFPIFGGPNVFFQNLTGPWPQLQEGRKIPDNTLKNASQSQNFFIR